MLKFMKNLEIKNLSKTFCKQRNGSTLDILKNISFKFEQDKSYAIMGVSGSGKSTLLHLLSGLEIPTEGQILFNGQSLTDFTQADKDYYLNKTIGLLFKDPFLIRELNIWQNVASKTFDLNIENKIKAEKLLSSIGILDKAEEYPDALSGGQLQRVSILRAIFNAPAFLLADEPTGNLDAYSAKELIKFLLKCKQEWDLGMIISTHDSAVASQMDIVLNLQDGKLVLI